MATSGLGTFPWPDCLKKCIGDLPLLGICGADYFRVAEDPGAIKQRWILQEDRAAMVSRGEWEWIVATK
jgi:hypothetical protein